MNSAGKSHQAVLKEIFPYQPPPYTGNVSRGLSQGTVAQDKPLNEQSAAGHDRQRCPKAATHKQQYPGLILHVPRIVGVRHQWHSDSILACPRPLLPQVREPLP
ncbi:hypothetical protein D3C78_1498010 [compost metagenome]